LPAEDYVISAGAPGHASTLVGHGKVLTIGREGLVNTGLDASLEPGGATLSGIVTDATGGPVQGATVQANSEYTSGKIMPQETSSDEAGTFTLSVAKGPVLVLAHADGYASASVTRYAPDNFVRLVLTPAARIAGRVVTNAGGQPVAGAQVRASGSVGTAAAVSDATGSFVIEGLRPDSYRLEASANGWRSSNPVNVVVDLLDSLGGVVLALDRAFAVEGMVMADGAPCELGEVRIGSESGSGPMYQAFTRPSGAVRVEAVPPGTYDSMGFCADGFVRGPQIQVSDRDVSGLVWSLAPGVDVAIRARSSAGAPVPRVGVTLDPQSDDMARKFADRRTGTTGDDGRVLLRRVKPGPYLLVGQGMKTPLALDVSLATARREIPIVLEPMGFIEVHVSTPDGKPNDDVAVSAVPFEPGPTLALAERRGDGVFAMGPLPAGQYRVEVRDGVNPRATHPSGAPVVISMDVTTKVDLVFGGYAGVISGRVLSGANEPLANVWVSAASSDMEDDAPGLMLSGTMQADARKVLTDAQGAFQLGELNTASTFTVSATRPLGGGSQIANVKPGQSIELILPAPGRIAGAVVSASREPVGNFQLSVNNTGAGQTLTRVFTDPMGRFALEDVAPGDVEISAVELPGGAQAAARLQLSAGQAATGVVIELAANSTGAP
jgi:protocatechuate 3,4-dioxygenase beta subunit